LKRCDIVIVATQGDFGKPRPALVVQADCFDEHPTVVILLLTSDLRELPICRVDIKPTAENGLTKHSQVMVDKIITVLREKIGAVVGSVDKKTMFEIDNRLAVLLGIAQ